jgi:hypothetical protein
VKTRMTARRRNKETRQLNARVLRTRCNEIEQRQKVTEPTLGDRYPCPGT